MGSDLSFHGNAARADDEVKNELKKRIARLEKALVWAVKHDARILRDSDDRMILDWIPDEGRAAGFVLSADDLRSQMIETLCRLAEGE